MLTMNLSKMEPNEIIAPLEGHFLQAERWIDTLIETDTTVYKPDGELLLIFLKNVLPPDLCQQTFPLIKVAATVTDNRGAAGGVLQDGESYYDFHHMANNERIAALIPKLNKDGTLSSRVATIHTDGTMSNQFKARQVNSGVAGFFERSVRYPFCRQTAFTANHWEKFKQCVPFFQAVSAVFKEYGGEHYDRQCDAAMQCHPDWVIPGTVFSTVTVNKNFRTAAHFDAGDFQPGLGCLTALRRGKFSGCFFTYPQFRVGVNVGTRDVLLSNVHELHGNTEIIGNRGTFERVSQVHYFRTNMVMCGSAMQEMNRAKARNIGAGEPIMDPDEDMSWYADDDTLVT